MLNKKIDVTVGGSGKNFYPFPADKYIVQISDVNTEEKTSPFTGELETLLNFEFTILDSKTFETPDKTIEGIRGRKLWKRMRPAIADGTKGKASWLYKLCCAVEKKAGDIEYFKEMAENPDAMVGQQVCVMVNKAPGSNGVEYNNILDFSPVTKELEPFETANQEDKKEKVSEEDIPF